jgi:uroporphyrinogen III methyltransferase / synthase
VDRFKKSGIVYLVGAGPGDPGLLTLRGALLLEQAEVVVYDSLANPRLLSYCPQAELIYVGKKASAHSMPQEQINALLVEKGKLGKNVVRLKGGDPFVFGRGGEECQALAAARVRFEVVPGVTAAVAAAAYAGIPVTHRDFNSSFTLVTGHEKENEPSDIAWDVLAKLPCVAFYMGVKSLPTICAKLIEHGMSPQTPAAVISRGTLPGQRTVVSTISELPQAVEEAKLETPAVTIVGKVVSLRPTIDWFGKRPLLGKTIVVTRTRQQASELSAQLESMGANVLEAPTITLQPAADSKAVDAALTSAGKFDWIIFTSANGVTATKQRLAKINGDIRLFGKAKIAAIGNATAKAIENELCLKVDLLPKQFVAEALADELVAGGQANGKRFLLLRADIARPLLAQRLIEFGAEVADVAIYETRPVDSLPGELIQALDQRQVDWVTFTSSSTAKNFVNLLGPDYRAKLNGVKIASIGPITSQSLAELKLTPTVQAEEFDIPGLVRALADFR